MCLTSFRSHSPLRRDIMRCWVQKNPLNKKRAQDEKSSGYKILAKAPKFQANFTPSAAQLEKMKTKKVACRHPQNPEDFWGPKRRASGKHHLNTHGGGKVDRDPDGGEQKRKKKQKQKKRKKQGGSEQREQASESECKRPRDGA